MTIDDALRRGAGRLAGAGVPEAAWNAEALLRHVLGWDRATLLTRGLDSLPAEAEARFLALLEERARRRPLQHLTGSQAFWRHDFRVTPDVFIPRPETELLVETALELLRETPRPLVADVGTGSGCIALSLAAERPDATVYATDVSPAALAVAEENARRLGLEGRVRFREGDLLDEVAEEKRGFHLVVSNPPYVEPAEFESLSPEVREHEPRVALVPPGDRYSFYCRLAAQAGPLLCPGGRLALELGAGMQAEVARICEGAGGEVEQVRPDLQGIPRVLVAVWRAGRPLA